MLLTDHARVNRILNHIRLSPFTIPNRTTTKLGNTGRVGNWIEQQFGIRQNSSTEPDSPYGELKTLGVSRRIGKTSIGNLSWAEYQKLQQSPNPRWSKSEPYKKMERSLWVFWEYEDENPENPVYRLRSWHYLALKDLDRRTKSILEEDYQAAVSLIKKRNYENSATYSGQYLDLGSKGDCEYVYPNWKFSSEFVRKIMSGSIGLALSDWPVEAIQSDDLMPVDRLFDWS